MRTPAPDLVFVSYSHVDRAWMLWLKAMPAPERRSQRLELWVDEHIQVGDEWRREIHSAVQRARLAMCLITKDFLDSRFIMEEELPALRAAGVRLVLVHTCRWRSVPVLERVQWAHDPKYPLDWRKRSRRGTGPAGGGSVRAAGGAAPTRRRPRLHPRRRPPVMTQFRNG